MSKIKKISAFEILDSRGNPTVMVELETEKSHGTARVPSGASTGAHEAVELRDNDKKRYGGKGVLKAVENVNGVIAEAVKGREASDQKGLDEALIALDGTENKGKLGANAILGVSMAAAVASANEQGKQLFEYLGAIGGAMRSDVLPTPMMNILNGGKHADSGLEIQEFMIVPAGAQSFAEAVRMGAEVFHVLKKLLVEKGFSVGVGDEGGFAPKLATNEDALDFIVKAIETAGYKAGQDVYIAMDAAASEFYDVNFKKYKLKVAGQAREPNSADLGDFYAGLMAKYPIIFLEDPFAEDDFEGFINFTAKAGDKIQIVGDDVFVTNIKRLKEGIDKRAANAILIKLNQIGTVTETIAAVKMAQDAGWHTIISHRSGETEDTFIADLAVGLNAGQIKTGSLCRSERVAKYNRLIRIEKFLGQRAVYFGKKVLNRPSAEGGTQAL